MDNGEVYISQNEQACILLKIRKNEKFNLKTILQDIRLVLKCIGIERIYSVIKRQRIVKRNYPKEHHIRPMIIGSKSESKGNGSAARLMLEVINKYKNNKLPVIIDASSEHNARLYQKLGFKTIKIETDLGFPIYILRLN